MTNKFLIGLFLSLLTTAVWAQTPSDSVQVQWTRNGSANLTFANVGLSNWAGGGQSSISFGLLLDGKIVRETAKSRWENTANLAFGMARVGGKNQLFKKTDDMLVLGSKYGYKLSQTWSASAVTELRSQAAPGYTYATAADGKEYQKNTISDLFAPAYWRIELGAEYKTSKFSARLSPLGSRITFVLNDSLSQQGAFGVEAGKKVRTELGANFNSTLELQLLENVTFKSALNLFGNYQTLDRIDVNWDTFLVMKINKYMNAGFTTGLIYDHDVLLPQSDGSKKQAIQFKHVLTLTIGLKY
jgi:hypothetical protein